MNSNYFYSNIVQTSKNKSFLEEMQSIAESIKQQVYVLSGPLIDGKYQYNDDSLIILLSSKKKIAFVTTSKMNDNFKDLCEDIIEDIGSVSDKYGYKEKIGRPRKWRDRLTGIYSLKEIDDVRAWFCNDIVINDTADFRTLDLLISLFIGSINDVKNITAEEPDNLLDKVKHKIQLFDGQQTRFIYEELDAEGKRITIQGLSGTGKTELLMHKLKDLYVKNEDAVFGFTCFNKILSRKLKERIPEFFNFMKVEQQIDWNKLLCVSAWGNYGNEYSGIYRYICSFYDISFYSLRECGSFDVACQKAIEQVRDRIKAYGHAFTYIFIDESQDFKESFFKLCELVTEKKCFIAGDIFQSIFEEKKKDTIPPNFLLSKCYRTDPKTLMFAQALGMGLFEKEKLWWLDKEQWEQCGYHVEIEGKQYTLTRDPLRRFEDIDPDFANTVEQGDIIVAGQNFGCGSSREHAPLCLKTAGVKCIIAKSFARIFYRNSINIGFPIMECPEAVDGIEQGDEVTVDFGSGVITNVTKGKSYQSQPFPEFLQKMIAADGLVNYVNAKRGK